MPFTSCRASSRSPSSQDAGGQEGARRARRGPLSHPPAPRPGRSARPPPPPPPHQGDGRGLGRRDEAEADAEAVRLLALLTADGVGRDRLAARDNELVV